MIIVQPEEMNAMEKVNRFFVWTRLITQGEVLSIFIPDRLSAPQDIFLILKMP
jgi:hypothetical protein